MISVQNHLQQLSGNKILLILAICFLASCSPKTSTVQKPSVPSVGKPTKDFDDRLKDPIKKDKEETREIVISLVLPFDLSNINYRTATLKDINKAEIAIDFYQGFKMAIDSVANNMGGNFKLQVYDSKDDPTNIKNLASKAGIKNSDLIVGPVFPNGIKAFAQYAKSMKKLVINPLAASDPKTFDNPYLISINNSLDQHTTKALEFIKSDLKAKKIILIRSGQADEYKYAVPFKEAKDSLAKNIPLSEIGIKAVGYDNVYKHLNPTGLNVIVLPSTERNFLLTILQTLNTLSNTYNLAVILHPELEKTTFLDVKILQKINTYITSSYKIDYKTPQINQFIKNYHQHFNFEPSEYAFKGFDIGYYFAQTLRKNINKEDFNIINNKEFTGLHNNFLFKKNNESGYYNSSLMVLKYEDFQLKRVK
jgi:ABC-type branched-subunit amino acid transport system substrate-binding protein